MSNLKLVPDDPTPLEKLLLDASRAELPSEDHKARMRAMLGIGLPMSGPLAAPPPAAASGQAAAAGVAPVAGTAAKSATLGKVAVGVGIAALIGAFAFTQKPAPAPVPVAKPVAAAPVAAAPVAAPQVQEAAPAVSPLPPVETPASATHAARADASASATADLSEQIRLIEAARAGVAAHDAKAAMSALDAYGAKFPRGSFGQEALVLRIRAVDQSGDSARATALAKSFVTRFPNSPHVARLKPIAERGASR
jgi:hypothetical protein